MFNQSYHFTPPTCTLEIRSNQPLLYSWLKPNIFEQLQFKLSFDDPRLPDAQQVTISGDRADLERLKLVVDDYVQNLLANSLTVPNPAPAKVVNPRQSTTQLHLQSQGLVNHELCFGHLNHDSPKQQVTLSTVQLFDLATALESYRTHVANLAASKQIPRVKLFSMTGAIATTALAVVGVTAIWLRSRPVSDLASTPQAESSGAMRQLDEIVPPAKPENREATPQPQIGASISSRQKLPPPPAVDAPKPQPNIPNPADYPLERVARQSGFQPDPQKDEPKAQSSDRFSPEAETLITIPPSASETTNNPENNNLNNDLNNSHDNFQTQTPIDPTSNQSDVALESNNANPNQLEQINAYFQETWQPPAALKQSLEYRIYLNQNGSIKQVVPLGKASRLYLSQTKIPVRGETFISPLQESDSSTIRLLLNPDGGVQTIAE